MTAARRLTDLFAVVGMLLLVGSVGGAGWWMTRPTPPPVVPPLDPERLDVVCTGRIDAAGMVIPLLPVRAGRIVEVAATDGLSVAKGQVLLRMDDTAAKAALTQAEAAVAVAKAEIESAVKQAERVPDQLAARDELLKAAAARVEAAKKLFEQRKEQQAVAPLGKAERESIEAKIRELEALEAAERGQVADLRKLDPQLPVRVAQARLSAAEADLVLARQAVVETVVVAPEDGTVLRVQAALGALIGPESPVPPLVFAPSGPLVVRAEIEQEFLGRVRDGMRAEVRDESRADGPIWSGRVARISQWVARKRTFLLDPGEINDVRTAECLIELDSSGDGLWIGQRVRVRLIRE